MEAARDKAAKELDRLQLLEQEIIRKKVEQLTDLSA